MRVSVLVFWGLACSLFTARALAEESGTSPVPEAAQHFTTGFSLASAQKYPEAIEEFERAYQLSPHYSVLYNLGFAYAMAGMPAEAVTTLRRFLVEGGNNIQPSYRKDVTTAIETNLRRTGRLKIVVLPEPNVPAVIDSKPIDTAALKSEILLSVGAHFFFIAAPGFRAQHVPFKIKAGELTKLELRLESEQQRQAPESGSGALAVHCKVPGAKLSIDGNVETDVPAQSVLLASGRHRLAFSREGYQANEVELTLVGNGRSEIDCGLSPLPKLAAEKSARLRVSAAGKSVVLVNGRLYRGETLPLGLHDVEVTHPDYLPFKQRVKLKTPRVEQLSVPLKATPEHATEFERERSNLRFWGYVTAGAGLAMGATALVIYVNSSSEFDELEKRRAKYIQSFDQARPSGDNLKITSKRWMEDSTRIRRNDDISLAFAVGGGACLAAASYLLWRGIWGQDSARSQLFATHNSLGLRTQW